MTVPTSDPKRHPAFYILIGAVVILLANVVTFVIRWRSGSRLNLISPALGIISMSLVILSMFLTNRSYKKALRDRPPRE